MRALVPFPDRLLMIRIVNRMPASAGSIAALPSWQLGRKRNVETVTVTK
jgi:hypothetical protein